MNLSSKNLSVEETACLNRGLKFGILPKKVDEMKIKTAIESCVKKVVGKEAQGVKLEIRDEIKAAMWKFMHDADALCKKPQNVLMHRTLKNLSNENSIKVCRFDKGNGVAILDSKSYCEKLSLIVNDASKFSPVNFDINNQSLSTVTKAPWILKEKSIRYYLNTYFKFLDETTLWKLSPTGTVPGKLYGLAKVHKTGCPLRPVNCMVNTPEYNISKYLDTLIKPLVPSEFSVKSTYDFLEKIKSTQLAKTDVLVSFDVVSLFTNVPRVHTINRIADGFYDTVRNTIEGDEDARSKLCKHMKKSVFKTLLQKCTKSHFLFNKKIYQQVDGVQMGCPLGPTFANWFLGDIEQNIFKTAQPFYPKTYLRYVDDVFAVFKNNSDVELFLDLLNSQHGQLQFTMEKAKGDSLPFLDVEIKLSDLGLDTQVYRKKTDTGTILHYDSVAPQSWKTGLFKCLTHRAKKICNSTTSLSNEICHIKELFWKNGYPRWWLEREEGRSENEDQRTPEESENKRFAILKLPFLGLCSNKPGRKLSKILEGEYDIKIRTVYSNYKVGNYFVLKDRLSPPLTPNVVYEFKCAVDSAVSYIGMTTRQLAVRISEHFDPKKQSAVQDHVAMCRGCSNSNALDRFVILRTCQNSTETECSEAILIKKHLPSLNKQLAVSMGCQFLIKVFK